MEQDFASLLKKKAEAQKGSPVNPDLLKAKSEKVKELMDMVKGMMGDDIDGMKKVTVASNSPEGITEGLDKAKEMMSGKNKILKDLEESPKEEALETPKEEATEDESKEIHSGDEDSKIAELEKQLEILKAKKEIKKPF